MYLIYDQYDRGEDKNRKEDRPWKKSKAQEIKIKALPHTSGTVPLFIYGDWLEESGDINAKAIGNGE